MTSHDYHFLQLLLDDRVTLAKWMNTLSFLEHIGSRKILKSQKSENLSFEILNHLAEEARHAAFIKKIALKLDPQVTSYQDKHLFCGQEAKEYILTLDERCHHFLQSLPVSENETYYWVTYLIEVRAT